MENKKKKVAVFGDTILDIFSYYTSPRLSPEAPVPVIVENRRDYFAGGAGLLSKQMSEMDISIDLYTEIGEDLNGKVLKKKLQNINIFDYSKKSYQTTLKERIIVDNKYYLRKDTEKFQRPIKKNILSDFYRSLSSYDAVIFSDYAKGFLDSQLFYSLKNMAIKKGILTFVDPSIKNIFDFNDITYFKPNLDESIHISSKKNISEILHTIAKSYNTTPVITLGSDGSVSLLNSDIIYSKSYKNKVIDTSGSGDIFFAYFIDSILSANTLKYSLDIASKKASENVKSFGFLKK
tara:strand:+ start:1339 stop:2214 length:876 start_codon:yes stop_codon:yes gene_type:complete